MFFNRRFIRIKVLHALYASQLGSKKIELAKSQAIMDENLRTAYTLANFLLYALISLGQYVRTVSQRRADKNLPTAEDLNVSIKLALHPILQKINNDFVYQKNVKDLKGLIYDPYLEVMINSAYDKLVATPTYQEYIETEQETTEQENAILKFIIKEIFLNNEIFSDFLSSHFLHYEVDMVLMNALVYHTIEASCVTDFFETVTADSRGFANSLLSTYIKNDAYIKQLIIPHLQNWEYDRIAVLDKLIMQLAICEILFFENIPAKVTINEYIDIAKNFSTEESGQFINGVVDSIYRQQLAAGTVKKAE